MLEVLETLSEKLNRYPLWDEAKVKQYVIEPVFQKVLGWDTHDELVFVTESISDVYGSSGKKVDYALHKEGNCPAFIVECKRNGFDLSRSIGQLQAYYANTDTKLAVLTNGGDWWFFSDFDKDNLMDNAPFLKLTLQELWDDPELLELFQLLSYGGLDVKQFLEKASRRALGIELRSLLSCPSEEFLEVLFWEIESKGKKNFLSSEQSKEILRELLVGFVNSKNEPVLEEVTGEEKDHESAAEESGFRWKNSYAKGKFRSSTGIVVRGHDGSLRDGWVNYWKKISEEKEFNQLLREAAETGELGGVVSDKPKISSREKPLNELINEKVFLYCVYSSKQRLIEMKRLSDYLGIATEIVYEPDPMFEAQARELIFKEFQEPFPKGLSSTFLELEDAYKFSFSPTKNLAVIVRRDGTYSTDSSND